MKVEQYYFECTNGYQASIHVLDGILNQVTLSKSYDAQVIINEYVIDDPEISNKVLDMVEEVINEKCELVEIVEEYETRVRLK